MQNQIKTVIEFGGFYNSIHSSIIDNDIDSYIEYMNDENDTELEEYDYNFNYSDMYNQYLKQYISDYIDFIELEYNLNIKINDISLYSPKEYNFKTDEIDCFISKSDEIKLIKYFKKDNDFLEYLKDHTKSYDGFWSHYTYETAINNKDDILTLYIFEYIANKYQKSDRFNIDIHVDINENTSELIT